MNTKTTSQKIPKLEASLMGKIEEILGMSQKEISENDEVKDIVSKVVTGKYSSEKDVVLDLVMRNGGNYPKISEKLKQDKDIIQALLLGNPDFFYMLPIKQKKDISILYVTIESMIKSGKDIFMVERFIETLQVSQKIKEKLFEFYSETISKQQAGKNRGIESFLSYFLIAFPELYTFLREKKFFENRDGTLKLSEKSKKILLELSQLFVNETDGEKKNKALRTRIADIFGINPNDKDSNIQEFLEWMRTHIEKKSPKKEDEDVIEDNGEKQQQKIPKQEEEVPVYTSQYSYTRGSSGVVNFDMSGGKKVAISESELHDMSSRALENYLSFLEVFDTLGLSFLSRKYRNQFFSLGEVDYLHGEGITEGKILKLLNFIGRNIGVPQESYEDEEGNTKISCFQTLAGAKLAFGDIRSTGKISGKLICEPSKRGDHSIVEIYMMHHGLLDTQGKGIMSYKWG